jgi:hypothetical protein
VRGRKRKRKQAEADQQQQQGGGGAVKKGKEEEFGVTRGIDFKGVRSVINYDIPDSLQVGGEQWAGSPCVCIVCEGVGVCVCGGGGDM